jgi:glutaredoxin
LHDIWEEPEAAEFVRSVNDGAETVPTVVVDGTAYTNPPPDQLVAHLLQT